MLPAPWTRRASRKPTLRVADWIDGKAAAEEQAVKGEMRARALNVDARGHAPGLRWGAVFLRQRSTTTLQTAKKGTLRACQTTGEAGSSAEQTATATGGAA